MIGSEAISPQKRQRETRYDSTRPGERPQLQLVRKVEVDRSRDALLTDFGKTTLEDRYLLPGESYQDMFARVATAYADDAEHAQRIYDYISQLWFMPATPVLSNGGADRGLPISCFLNSVSDSLEGIVGSWNENVWLAANGGGIGTYWGGVRSIGERVKGQGQTSGIIPFIRVMDSLTLPTDIFGSAPASFSPTKRLGSNASRLSQIQDGKWKAISEYYSDVEPDAAKPAAKPAAKK